MLCVLLKHSLYYRNNSFMYFVNFVVVNSISCIMIIARGFWIYVIRFCMQGMAVLNDEAFYVMM